MSYCSRRRSFITCTALNWTKLYCTELYCYCTHHDPVLQYSNTQTHTIVHTLYTLFCPSSSILGCLLGCSLFAWLLASILELSFSRLHGSDPSLHYPLLPHYSTVLTFLACSNRFSSPASHRTSLIAQLETPLRCVCYWTKPGNAVAHLSLASWYEHSTPTSRH